MIKGQILAHDIAIGSMSTSSNLSSDFDSNPAPTWPCPKVEAKRGDRETIEATDTSISG